MLSHSRVLDSYLAPDRTGPQLSQRAGKSGSGIGFVESGSDRLKQTYRPSPRLRPVSEITWTENWIGITAGFDLVRKKSVYAYSENGLDDGLPGGGASPAWTFIEP